MNWKPVIVVKGESVKLPYQLYETAAARDITGMAFRFAVKERLSDTVYKIGPVDGLIEDAVEGKFSIALDSTHTGQSPFAGVCGLAMYDPAGNKTVLTPPGGVVFRLIEDIID